MATHLVTHRVTEKKVAQVWDLRERGGGKRELFLFSAPFLTRFLGRERKRVRNGAEKRRLACVSVGLERERESERERQVESENY